MTATVTPIRPPERDVRQVVLAADEWEIIRRALAVARSVSERDTAEMVSFLDTRIGMQLGHPSSRMPSA